MKHRRDLSRDAYYKISRHTWLARNESLVFPLAAKRWNLPVTKPFYYIIWIEV